MTNPGHTLHFYDQRLAPRPGQNEKGRNEKVADLFFLRSGGRGNS